MNINSSKPPQSQGSNLGPQQAQNVQKQAAVEQKQKAAQPGSTNAPDRIDISGQSKEIAELQAAVNQLPDIRADKVQEIKKSVEAGTYTVDASKVAESILKSI
ncbi:MAG TPA: flagellar biosynthesis anti-sigma factor FlgM [Nitrospirota bacterium]|nr:flagellar biosynthesis anti-sigma factor FlgM [Nitrospirota bacterium]